MLAPISIDCKLALLRRKGKQADKLSFRKLRWPTMYNLLKSPAGLSEKGLYKVDKPIGEF